MSSAIRVRPAAASRQQGDRSIDVEPTAIAVEPWGPGRALVHQADVDAWAIVGEDRPATVDGPRTIEVVVRGWRFELEVEDAGRAALRERATRSRADAGHDGPLEIRAVIPGRVVGVAVTPGDVVEAGQTLLVIEAMKMQNELRSPRAGSIERLAVGAGETIELGQLLAVLA